MARRDTDEILSIIQSIYKKLGVNLPFELPKANLFGMGAPKINLPFAQIKKFNASADPGNIYRNMQIDKSVVKILFADFFLRIQDKTLFEIMEIYRTNYIFDENPLFELFELIPLYERILLEEKQKGIITEEFVLSRVQFLAAIQDRLQALDSSELLATIPDGMKKGFHNAQIPEVWNFLNMPKEHLEKHLKEAPDEQIADLKNDYNVYLTPQNSENIVKKDPNNLIKSIGMVLLSLTIIALFVFAPPTAIVIGLGILAYPIYKSVAYVEGLKREESKQVEAFSAALNNPATIECILGSPASTDLLASIAPKMPGVPSQTNPPAILQARPQSPDAVIPQSPTLGKKPGGKP